MTYSNFLIFWEAGRVKCDSVDSLLIASCEERFEHISDEYQLWKECFRKFSEKFSVELVVRSVIRSIVNEGLDLSS